MIVQQAQPMFYFNVWNGSIQTQGQSDQRLANNRQVLASRLICLTTATADIAPTIEKTTAIVVFNQKMGLRLDGLKVNLQKSIGSMKSRGKNPKAPITALMSPKNGSIAAMVVAAMTDSDRDITLGITLIVGRKLWGLWITKCTLKHLVCRLQIHLQ